MQQVKPPPPQQGGRGGRALIDRPDPAAARFVRRIGCAFRRCLRKARSCTSSNFGRDDFPDDCWICSR